MSEKAIKEYRKDLKERKFIYVFLEFKIYKNPKKELLIGEIDFNSSVSTRQRKNNFNYIGEYSIINERGKELYCLVTDNEKRLIVGNIFISGAGTYNRKINMDFWDDVKEVFQEQSTGKIKYIFKINQKKFYYGFVDYVLKKHFF